MQQQMGALVRQLTGLRAAGGISFSSGDDHGQQRVVVRTGRARRPGRVTAAVAGPKYRRHRGAAAIAVPETSRELLDQNVRPSNTAWNQLGTITRLAERSFDHHLLGFQDATMHVPWLMMNYPDDVCGTRTQEGQVLRDRDEGRRRRARRVRRRQQRHLRQLPPQW